MSQDLADTATFDAFFQAIHGYAPFPWQTRLVRKILDEGRWPDILDLPTGVGKTCALDIALYTLAAQPDKFPRRIILVVDRRVVVDQGAEHAAEILGKIKKSDAPAAQVVAARLRQLWGAQPDEDPFVISVLRGGMPRDNTWSRRPDQPVVALSTVDQVGSRLLFRGYGLSGSMAPIHAGLLGQDALILLDEVQLSNAFADTLLAIRDRWRPWHGQKLPQRWDFVRMSATPTTHERDRIFGLDDLDRTHPELQKRLNSHKTARLELVAVKGEEENRQSTFASKITEAAREAVQDAQRVLVVVNRVDTARRIQQNLVAASVEAVLLTGRMRPLDREALFGDPKKPGALLARVGAKAARDPALPPLVVVATQCIEAGADFDFDVLLTECASLDALRQRFGRLDRRGYRKESNAVIFARSDWVSESAKEDPIYGTALASTWHWLLGQAKEGRVPMGIGEFVAPTASTLRSLASPLVQAPLLLPSHLNFWAQTSPRPNPDPQVGPWLHGPQRSTPEVRLVWRATLSEALLNDSNKEASVERIEAMLNTCPPGSAEALSISLFAAQQWLRGGAQPDIADVEGAREASPEAQAAPSRRVVRWRDGVEIIDAEQIKPDDTLIVPCAYGGIKNYNWAPTNTEPVTDWTELMMLRQRGRAVMRLHGEVWAQHNLPLLSELPRPPQDELDQEEAKEALQTFWEQLCTVELPGYWREIFRPGERPKLIVLSDHYAWLWKKRRPINPLLGGDEFTTEDDLASFTGTEVKLSEHSQHVYTWAQKFAVNLHLPTELAQDIGLAAWLHDVGKADPRFQRMLVGSDVRWSQLQTSDYLAKSATTAYEARSYRAQNRAHYPRGYRHELLSVAMLASADEIRAQAHDWDLVLHLVGSHHGWCRPFPPFADHPEALPTTFELSYPDQDQKKVSLSGSTRHQLARLDSGVAERFWALVDRYGWWGLAWLEGLVRLADHRASEAEQEQKV